MVASLGLTAAVGRFGRAELAERAKTELVGMKKSDLLACAGVPLRQATEGPFEYLSYSASSRILRTRYCEATFTLKDGVVQKLVYAGRTGGLLSGDEQCALIVGNCLKE